MGLRTMLYYQGLAEQNAAIRQKLDIESEPIINAAIEQELDTQDVPIENAAVICEGQRLWLSVATSLLTVIITAETTVWSPDQMSEKDMVLRASRMARLLIETVIE